MVGGPDTKMGKESVLNYITINEILDVKKTHPVFVAPSPLAQGVPAWQKGRSGHIMRGGLALKIYTYTSWNIFGLNFGITFRERSGAAL